MKTNSVTPVIISALISAFTTQKSFSQEISINQRSYLVVNGNASIVVNNAAFKNNGQFNSGTGTVIMSGNSDSTTSYVSGNSNSFYNFSVNKTGGSAALKNTSSVKNTFTINGGTLFTDNNLVLKSDSSITARVAPITAGNINGKVTVERYIPARRAWRMLTAPLTGTGSIYSNWQNNGVYEAGINTFVTGPNAGAANGLDVSPQNNISMKKWNSATQSFNNVTNTYTSLSEGATGNADNTGYFIFVRGDRNAVNFNTTNCNATTLSATGYLQTGTQTFNVATAAGAYTMVGNPYASPVNFSSISRNNVVNRFYVWDPTLNELGGYVMLDDISNTGTYTKSVSASSQTKEIQSGQAFLVQTTAAGTANVVFGESSKASYNNTLVFRPASSPITQSVRVNLGIIKANGSITEADGVLAEFNENFSNDVDVDDALKFTNINENIAFVRNNTSLTAERKQLAAQDDTLFIRLWKTGIKDYQFSFDVNGLESKQVILQDTYRNTNITLSSNGTSTFHFAIDANTASANVNRFRIIFRNYNVLPVNITSITATANNNKVAVEWSTENEINISNYTIEKSDNGTNFTAAGTVNAAAHNSYTWFDVTPAPGTNFYRIRITEANGSVKYSAIVKASVNKQTAADISIYPNPVKGNNINLLLNNQPKGEYHVTLVNLAGQVLHTGSLFSNSENSVLVVNVHTRLATGIYQLQLVMPNGEKVTKQVIAE